MSFACGNCPQVKSDCYLPQCATADGQLRGMTTINRLIPGAAIQVCQGDTVSVDVVNDLPSDTVTIHWHGIRQIGTQYYDGVPYVTQCPIGPRMTFRYQFHTPEAGTFFYHSHAGLQKVDGISGPLIVRDGPGKVHTAKYDYDLPSHTLFLQDWMHEQAIDRYPGMQKGRIPSRLPASYLINGRGIFIGTNKSLDEMAEAVGNSSQPPVTTVNVTSGSVYRFRIIGGICIACPVMMFIEGHKLTIITTDGGHDVQPKTVDRITINSGERFDVLLNATQPIDAYWIAVVGIGECIGANQLGILRYAGGPARPDQSNSVSGITAPGPLSFNPYNSFCNSSTPNDICVSHLVGAISPHIPPDILTRRAAVRKLVMFGFHVYTVQELYQSGTYEPYFYVVPTNNNIRSWVNNISYEAPPSPLISQYCDIPKDLFCKPSCTEEENCICVNVVKLPLNEVVDIVISDYVPYDSENPAHPFHLHGFNFYVVEEGIHNTSITIDQSLQRIYDRLDNGEIINKNAPMKDTITLQAGGYVIIRFYTNNPGFWLMHCHFLYHLETGMALVYQVGELFNLPKVPYGFPRCGSFVPEVNKF